MMQWGNIIDSLNGKKASNTATGHNDESQWSGDAMREYNGSRSKTEAGVEKI